MSNFAHLHCHTQYSLLDGANRIPELVKHAKSLGMNSIAVTDHGNMYGAFELVNVSKAEGFNGIVGLEAYIAPFARQEKTLGGCNGKEHSFHLTLLARNAVGFRNLVKLSSRAFLEGYYYKPRIDKAILEEHAEGLVCLSGCVASEFSDLIMSGRMDKAKELAVWSERIFDKDSYFIEIQDNGIDIQKEHAEIARDFARKNGMPLVATSDAHYLKQEDCDFHDILLCMSMKTTRSNKNRMKFGSDQFHVRSPQEMYKAMPNDHEAIKRTQEIANTVDYSGLDLGRRRFPSFSVPSGKVPDIMDLCLSAVHDRYGENPPEGMREQLDYEVSTIKNMGFEPYFLIVWDIVNFARENGIPCSARGSACGSLVSYLLYISHVDPISHGLLFERFLDPKRSEAPDIDIDICQSRRSEAIDYIKRKYGEDHVAQIATFGSLAARSVIRDVGRSLEVPLDRVDKLAKCVPQAVGVNLAIAETSQDFQDAVKADSSAPEIMRYARKIEGMVRNVGTHAAGVVISDEPVMNIIPIQRVKAGKVAGVETYNITTQWAMNDVEKAGMLKMDLLGLRNLTILKSTVDKIGIDIYKIPLDDDDTFELLRRGDTKGVFQLESGGIRDLLVRMQPDMFNDIIAVNALYRPGPLDGGMVDEYVDCKTGVKSPRYQNSIMEEVLSETYGVMVYQEQVMRILNRMGGIDLPAAYQVIKAISKKKHETIAKNKDQFIIGCSERGLDASEAKSVFELIEFFGGYGFNKSHSTAYAYLAYQTAFLKSHYPKEFMSSLMSSESGAQDRDKLREHMRDCLEMGIPILPPCVNESNYEFTDTSNGIRFGLSAIKSANSKSITAIIDERRKGGKYKDFHEFWTRFPKSVVTKSTAEAAIKAGAFDSLHTNRRALVENIESASAYGEKNHKYKAMKQRSIFDIIDDEGQKNEIIAGSGDYTFTERLAFEKEILGFHVSSGPLEPYLEIIPLISDAHDDFMDGEEFTFVGLVSSWEQRTIENKKDWPGKPKTTFNRMCKLSIDHLHGAYNAVIWPSEYKGIEDFIVDDAVLLFSGKVKGNDIVIKAATPILKAIDDHVESVVLSVAKSDADLLKNQAVRDMKGKKSLMFRVEDEESGIASLFLASKKFSASTSRYHLSAMAKIFGKPNVTFVIKGTEVEIPEPFYEKSP